MSHFAILVISDEEPTDEYLQTTLQPWHEYECTGVRDQYVVPVDKTDEVLEQFNSPKTVVIMPDGQVLDRYDDSFYHPKVGSRVLQKMREKLEAEAPDYSKEQVDELLATVAELAANDPHKYGVSPLDVTKEFRLPDQAEEREVTAEEARQHGLGYATMAECAEEYFGIDGSDHNPDGEPGRFYQWTNPNRKWDWWVVGGRWSGVLAPKYSPSEDPDNQEKCWLCNGTGTRCDSVTGNKPMRCNGCRGKGVAVKFSSNWKKVPQDRCRVSDLQLEALRDAAEQEALAEWEKWQPVVAGRPIPSWEEIRKRRIDSTPEDEPRDWDAARKEFNEDPVVLAIKEAAGEDYVWDMAELCERLRMTREDRAAQARRKAAVLFGYVKDGKWVERGSMGWFAMVSDEEDPEAWAKHYNEMLESLRPDQWVTVVDCHI